MLLSQPPRYRESKLEASRSRQMHRCAIADLSREREMNRHKILLVSTNRDFIVFLHFISFEFISRTDLTSFRNFTLVHAAKFGAHDSIVIFHFYVKFQKLGRSIKVKDKPVRL